MDTKVVVFNDPKTQGIREVKTGLGKHPDAGSDAKTPLYPAKKDQQYNDINSNRISSQEKDQGHNSVLENSNYPPTGFVKGKTDINKKDTKDNMNGK